MKARNNKASFASELPCPEYDCEPSVMLLYVHSPSLLKRNIKIFQVDAASSFCAHDVNLLEMR
jgi:hypothetical protein